MEKNDICTHNYKAQLFQFVTDIVFYNQKVTINAKLNRKVAM